MNRAVARRTLFESRADVELFLKLLGEVVERGLLEVHSYSVMTTHFHMLVSSPKKSMSDALHRVQLGYVRYFNRSRRRDGPLVRGRFQSKLVDSLAYRKNLIGYIDANAVHAQLVRDAADYEYSSSHAYSNGGGPAWLSRDWVEAFVDTAYGAVGFSGERYRDLFHDRFDRATYQFVEQRLHARSSAPDPTDSLLDGAAPEVMRWMRAKAKLADGTRPGLPVVPAVVISKLMAASSGQLVGPRSKQLAHVTCVLLRDFAGLSFSAIGSEIGVGRETARSYFARGRRVILEDRAVAHFVASVGHAALMSFYRPVATVDSPAPVSAV